MKINLDITKPYYSEQILQVPWPLVILSFHCQYLREVIKLIIEFGTILFID